MSQSIDLTYGTTVMYHNGSIYVAIGEVLDVQGPGMTRKEIAVDGISDTFKHKKLGKPDYGTVSLKIGSTSVGYNLFHTWFDANTASTIKITDANTNTEVFPCKVSSLSRMFPDDDKCTFDVTLTITLGVSVFT